jgi:phosphate acetyltransferase
MTQPGTGKYEHPLTRYRNLTPVPAAVAHPGGHTALEGAIEAGAHGVTRPILVGPASKIAEIAAKMNGITSEGLGRADSVRSRIASCAVAMLAAHARRQALAARV